MAEQFDLPTKLVRELSMLLGNCPNNDDDIAINLTEVRRSQAIERGQRHLKQLLRKAKRGSVGPQKLRKALGSLSTYFTSTPEDADLLPRLLGKFEAATTLLRMSSITFDASMDRLSRVQADITAIFKWLSFAGVGIVTLAEGEISELHVGLNGTMNRLFLKYLADKTWRGLRGRIEVGRSGGGNSYGYDVVRRLGTDSLHLNLSELYHTKVDDLAQAQADPAIRTGALELIRGLIERVSVQHEQEGVQIELEGALAAMIGLAQNEQSRPAAACSIMVVAG